MRRTHTSPSWGAASGFIYFGGLIHLGLWAGGAAGRKMLGCPGCFSRAPAQVPACSFSHEAPLLRGVSAAGGKGPRRPAPFSTSLGRLHRGVLLKSANRPIFVKVISSFLFGGRGSRRGAFSIEILFLVCRYQKETQHWACSDVEWFTDNKQPPGTKT